MHPGGCSVSTLFYSQLSYHYHSIAPRLLCSQFSLHCTQGSGRHGVARQTVCTSIYLPIYLDFGFSWVLHWGRKRKRNRKTKRKQKSLRKRKTKWYREETETESDVCSVCFYCHDAVNSESSVSLLQFDLGGFTISSLIQLRGQKYGQMHSSLQVQHMQSGDMPYFQIEMYVFLICSHLTK